MARPNLYAGIHKAIRLMLNDLVTRASQTDWNDGASVSALVDRVDAAFAQLESHAHHENTFIGPVLAQHCRDVYVELGSAHHTQEEQLEELRAQLDAIQPEDGHRFVVSLSRVVGELLTHMSDEEERAMPALWAALDDAALLDLHHRLVASIPPPEMLASMRWMIPALNHVERVGLLTDVQNNAPPPVFGALISLARDHLPAAEFARLEADLIPASQRAA